MLQHCRYYVSARDDVIAKTLFSLFITIFQGTEIDMVPLFGFAQHKAYSLTQSL